MSIDLSEHVVVHLLAGAEPPPPGEEAGGGGGEGAGVPIVPLQVLPPCHLVRQAGRRGGGAEGGGLGQPQQGHILGPRRAPVGWVEELGSDGEGLGVRIVGPPTPVVHAQDGHIVDELPDEDDLGAVGGGEDPGGGEDGGAAVVLVLHLRVPGDGHLPARWKLDDQQSDVDSKLVWAIYFYHVDPGHSS